MPRSHYGCLIAPARERGARAARRGVTRPRRPRPTFVAGLVTVAAVLNLGLAVVSWRRRSVLACLLGVIGVGLAFYSFAFAAIALAIGASLYGLGELFERLLDDEKCCQAGAGDGGPGS